MRLALIAAAVAAVLVASGTFGQTAIALFVAVGIALAFAASLVVDVRRS